MKGKSKWWKWVVGILAGMVIILAGVYLLLNGENLDLERDGAENAPGEFTELENGLVHYQLVGPKDAPLIVLIHGFSVPLYVWDPTALALEEAGYQVLSFDLYGRGYSARPDVEYDLDLFVDQLDELITNLELQSPTVVAGLSMGGPIAARYASLHPAEVAGVILIAPEVSPTSWKDIFPLNLPVVGDYLMAAVMEPLILPKLQAADFVHPENYPDWESKYRVQLRYRGTGRALLSTIRNLTSLDPTIEYRHLGDEGLPVLLIWGKKDATIGADQISLLQSLVPDIQTLVVPDAGHLPHYEQADLVNPRLVQFLEEVFPRQAAGE